MDEQLRAMVKAAVLETLQSEEFEDAVKRIVWATLEQESLSRSSLND